MNNHISLPLRLDMTKKKCDQKLLSINSKTVSLDTCPTALEFVTIAECVYVTHSNVSRC